MAPTEQIVNGGFESGSTGWVLYGSSSVIGTDYHSGSHCLHAVTTGFGHRCVQTLNNHIAGTAVISLTVWGKKTAGGDNPSTGILVVIQYTDTTEDECFYDFQGSGWEEFDVTSYVDVSKTIQAICVSPKYQQQGTTLTCLIDDVSLIGTPLTVITKVITEKMGASPNTEKGGVIQSDATGIQTRVKEVEILGYPLHGVIDAEWIDTDPWVRLQVPAGPLLEQHLLGPHIEGTIDTHNYISLCTLLYGTPVEWDANKFPIVEATNKKWIFSKDGNQFIITLEDAEGNEIDYSFTNVRIMRIELVKTPTSGLKEAVWRIHWMADTVKSSYYTEKYGP
jgi:hypothetical protein